MSNATIQSLFDQYVIPNYTRHPVAVIRGQGSWVWDADGRKYLDLFPGWGVSGLGHCHPRVAEAVRAQVEKLFHMPNNYYTEEQGRFAEMLSVRADGHQCFFANSGAEANEGAIKLARLHCQPRHKFISFENSFHGRSYATITATGQPHYQRGLGPLLPGFAYARLNDIDSVRALVDEATCGILVEPVQGEGGVYPCTLQFLQDLRRLCDETGMLLIFDEVQTTPARLGTWFGYQQFGVIPDILTSAKALAGGMPMGVVMAKPDIAPSLKPGTHASTFGGNAVGCAAGIATWQAIEAEHLLENIARLGPWIDRTSAALSEKTGGIEQVRRVGFMVGIQLRFPGDTVITDCREHGLLLNCTHRNVVRMLPAFNVTQKELEQGFDIFGDCLARAIRTEDPSS